jgi:glucose-6-phosphate 1-epimerase
MNAAELQSRFGLAGALDFVATEQGLVKAVVSHGGMSGELFLQGAQITAWQPAGARPVIFTSSHAVFAPGKAIRGGVPVIFPWFGPHPSDPHAPQHGLARTAAWDLEKAEQTAGGVSLELSLAIEGFALTYRVAFGGDLRVSLAARNTAASTATFEEALHTYFAVSEIERAAISGLEASGFIDKTDAMRRRPPAGVPLTLAKETDSVYLDVPGGLAITDPGWGRRIVIAKTGAASTIVWNPWPEKAAAMADLGADNWHGFVCVETGNVADDRVTIAAGATHEMTTRISVDAA